jgi:ABC-type transport system involved in multi-copper enzyme maturation permease subunit
MDEKDLGDWLGPMTVKELHQSMRRASFVYPFLVLQCLAVAMIVIEFAQKAQYRTEAAGFMNLAMVLESGPFWKMVFWICGVFMPLAGLVLMRPEQEDGNHELLQMTKLNRWAIVRGKFIVLWSVSSLSLISLQPYVVVRYFLGGIELWQELLCTLSVIGLAAVVSAGAIGASAYKNIAARIFVFVLFLGSFLTCASILLLPCALVTGRAGTMFHLLFSLNGLSVVVCYASLGLAIARSRLRLVVLHYELKPSRIYVLLMFFSPFLCGITTAISLGHAGMVGTILMTIAIMNTDVTFRKKKMPGAVNY